MSGTSVPAIAWRTATFRPMKARKSVHCAYPSCAAYWAIAGSADRAGVDTDENRRACSAEADRRALDDHPGHDGRHAGEPKPHEQWDGHGRGCAEAGGTLDKRSEQPGHDDDLDATIGCDVGESLADRLDRAAFLQRVSAAGSRRR